MNIDFKIDEDQLSDDLKEDVNSYDPVCFVSTIFIMPVKFNINGVELFKHNSDVWCEMPIMNVASEGLWCVHEAKRTGFKNYSIIEGPGDIQFRAIDSDNIEICYDFFDSNVRIVVDYIDLVRAFIDFSNKVRAFLWKRVPELNNNPYWGPWLRGEREC